MKTITFLFISCFVLLTTFSAKAEINYVPNVVHGFSIVGDIKQHRAECKNHDGNWDYKNKNFNFCDNPSLSIAPIVRPEALGWSLGWSNFLTIHYSFVDENRVAKSKYVENVWLEHLHNTYGEPTTFDQNQDADSSSYRWFWSFPKRGIVVLWCFRQHPTYEAPSGSILISYHTK